MRPRKVTQLNLAQGEKERCARFHSQLDKINIYEEKIWSHAHRFYSHCTHAGGDVARRAVSPPRLPDWLIYLIITPRENDGWFRCCRGTRHDAVRWHQYCCSKHGPSPNTHFDRALQAAHLHDNISLSLLLSCHSRNLWEQSIFSRKASCSSPSSSSCSSLHRKYFVSTTGGALCLDTPQKQSRAYPGATKR